MNIKEYISTGILEAYALGDLSESERLEVERNLAQYPELRAELSSIEESMETFFMKAGKAPSASVKAKVMQAIPEGKVVQMNTGRPVLVWQLATAASLVFALLMGIYGYVQRSNAIRIESELVALQTLNAQVAQDYNQVNQRIDKIEQDMKVMENPAFQRVVMKGTAGAPDALASVYWNQATQEVYLNIQNLRVLSQEQQYQLWAIVDGKPVDMGVFDGGVSGLLKMKVAGKAAAFAVTIEPRGGKPTPTLETMQVLGNT